VQFLGRGKVFPTGEEITVRNSVQGPRKWAENQQRERWQASSGG
jgi:hypothetical protein